MSFQHLLPKRWFPNCCTGRGIQTQPDHLTHLRSAGRVRKLEFVGEDIQEEEVLPRESSGKSHDDLLESLMESQHVHAKHGTP